MCSGVVMEKNGSPSFDQNRLQVLQYLLHLIDLLSTLLKCNGFTVIQKAVEDQTPLKSYHDLFFFDASLALGSPLEFLLSPITELVITGSIKSTLHLTSDQEMVHCYCIEKEKMTLQNVGF